MKHVSTMLFAVVMLLTTVAVNVFAAEPEIKKVQPAEIRSDPVQDLTKSFVITGVNLKGAFKVVDVDNKELADKCKVVTSTDTRLDFTCKIGKAESLKFWPTVGGKSNNDVYVSVRRADEPVITYLSPRLVTSHLKDKTKAKFQASGRYLKGVAVSAVDEQGARGGCEATDNSNPARIEFTCELEPGEKGKFWPMFGGVYFEQFSVTIQTAEEAQEAAIKTAQAVAASAAKRAKELETKLTGQETATSQLEARLKAAEERAIQALAELAGLKAAQANLQASVEDGLNKANSKTEGVERQVAGLRTTWGEELGRTQETVRDLGGIVADVGDARVKRGGFLGFGGTKPLDPRIRGRVERALAKLK